MSAKRALPLFDIALWGVPRGDAGSDRPVGTKRLRLCVPATIALLAKGTEGFAVVRRPNGKRRAGLKAYVVKAMTSFPTKGKKGEQRAAAAAGFSMAKPVKKVVRNHKESPKGKVWHASAANNAALLLSCLDDGGSTEEKDMDGETPVGVASRMGHLSIVQILLESGADVNAKNEFAATPLHNASGMGHTAIVEYLLSVKGVDVNAATVGGVTPLHLAASRGHTDVVRALLKSDYLDANARSMSGKTALDWARQHKKTDIVHLLTQAISRSSAPQK